MKKLMILFLILASPRFIVAQANNKISSEIILQNIATDLKKLDEKVDKKFEDVDARFDRIEQSIAKYDERFNSLNSKISFYGSIAGFVAMIILAAFGFMYNRIYGLNKALEKKKELAISLSQFYSGPIPSLSIWNGWSCRTGSRLCLW